MQRLSPGLKTFCRLSSALGLNFGLKFNKTFARFEAVLPGKPALKRFCCSENNEVFKGDFSFFVIKKRSPPLTPKRKNILLSVVHSHFVYNKVKA